jgi:hypothetical protein
MSACCPLTTAAAAEVSFPVAALSVAELLALSGSMTTSSSRRLLRLLLRGLGEDGEGVASVMGNTVVWSLVSGTSLPVAGATQQQQHVWWRMSRRTKHTKRRFMAAHVILQFGGAYQPNSANQPLWK